MPDLIYLLLVEVLVALACEMPVVIALPVVCAYTKGKAIILKQVNFAAFDADQVGLKAGEDIGAGKTTCDNLQG